MALGNCFYPFNALNSDQWLFFEFVTILYLYNFCLFKSHMSQILLENLATRRIDDSMIVKNLQYVICI